MKTKFPCLLAAEVATAIVGRFETAQAVDRITIAGSLRRGRPQVGDIEILYIPRRQELATPGDMFARTMVNLADDLIRVMLQDGTLAKRTNVNGSTMWGARNKMAVHVPTGIPVDLFATEPDCWENYLVCRTGPAALNTLIATIAKSRGYRWNPYGRGFSAVTAPKDFPVILERDVFDLAQLPYVAPDQRDALVAHRTGFVLTS